MAAQAGECDYSNSTNATATKEEKAEEATATAECKEKVDTNEKNYKEEAEVGSKSAGLTNEPAPPEGKDPKPSGIRACMMGDNGKPLDVCTACVNTIIAFGSPYSPVPWTNFAINYMIPAGACLSCLGRAVVNKLGKTCYGDKEKKEAEEGATRDMFQGSCTQEQVGTCVLLAEASKCAHRADKNASANPFGVHYSYGIQSVLQANSNKYKASILHGKLRVTSNPTATWQRPIQKAEDNVCNKLYYETRSIRGYNTKETDCMGRKPNAHKGCKDVQSMMREKIQQFPAVGEMIDKAKNRADVLKQCHAILGCNREVVDDSEFKSLEGAAATASSDKNADSLIDMSLIEANAESMTRLMAKAKGAAQWFQKVASFVKKIFLYVRYCGKNIFENLYLGTGITLGMADIFSPAPASMNLIVRCMPIQACAKCDWAKINPPIKPTDDAPKVSPNMKDAQEGDTALWKEAAAGEMEKPANPDEMPDNDGAVFLSVAETAAKTAKAAKVEAEAKAAMVQRNEGRKTMRNLIHEMFGLRLSAHRGVMEQMEELERWERRERVRGAAAKAAKAQRRMGHRQDAGLFMELSSQAASKSECTNKKYNTAHQNKVLSSEEVRKLTFEDAKDFGYLAGVVDSPTRQNNKMILDEVFKAEVFKDGTKSVPGATMEYPRMPYYDIGVTNAFRHKGGCGIYGKDDAKKWVPKVVPMKDCEKLTECKACASQPNCKWKTKAGKCNEYGVTQMIGGSILSGMGLKTSDSYHMAPEKCLPGSK